MIYPYNCEKHGYKEVFKSAAEASNKESCPECGLEMVRLYTVPQISTRDIYSGFNPAIGKRVKNKLHLQEELKRHHDTTGEKLVEVGSESAKARPKKKFDLSEKDYKRAGEMLTSVKDW